MSSYALSGLITIMNHQCMVKNYLKLVLWRFSTNFTALYENELNLYTKNFDISNRKWSKKFWCRKIASSENKSV